MTVAAFRDEVDRTHQFLLNAAVAFTASFVLLRGLTYAIRPGLAPVGNIVTGGIHIHHYVWGVGILLGVGLISPCGGQPALQPWLGGGVRDRHRIGRGRVALLLNLPDVYWSTEGRVSVDFALATIAVAWVYLAAKSFWRRLGRELASSLRKQPFISRGAGARVDCRCKPRVGTGSAGRRL